MDFKGAPPKISYLREIFPLISKAGANALLIEYEDMFPYSGKIVNASALNAFTVNQIQEILEAAKLHQLEVIPLVQTFGHLGTNWVYALTKKRPFLKDTFLYIFEI